METLHNVYAVDILFLMLQNENKLENTMQFYKSFICSLYVRSVSVQLDEKVTLMKTLKLK